MKTKKIVRKIKQLLVFTLVTCLVVACSNPNGKKGKKYSPQDFAEKLNLTQKQKLGKYSLRGNDDDNPTFQDSLSSAIKLSISGNYDDAKKALIELNEMNPDNEVVILQLAIQDFYTGNYSESMDKLSKVINSDDPDIRYEAEILMANASLSKDDNNKSAIKWFDKIADDSGHAYQKDAKDQIVIILETY